MQCARQEHRKKEENTKSFHSLQSALKSRCKSNPQRGGESAKAILMLAKLCHNGLQSLF
jgi:hypothetical protein